MKKPNTGQSNAQNEISTCKDSYPNVRKDSLGSVQAKKIQFKDEVNCNSATDNYQLQSNNNDRANSLQIKDKTVLWDNMSFSEQQTINPIYALSQDNEMDAEEQNSYESRWSLH